MPKVYYCRIMEMWCVDYGYRQEYFYSSDAAYRSAYGY